MYLTIKSPLVVTLRFVIAAALILPLSIHYADAVVRVLLPLYRSVFEFIGSDYQIIFFGLSAQGIESTIRVDISLAHATVVGGHVVWPDPRGVAHVTTLAVQAMQPITTALIATLGWPCPSLRRWLVRLCSLAVFLLLVVALDVPFIFAGELWSLIIDNASPGTESLLVSWNQFLQGGGRPALGLFAALASLAVEIAFAKTGRQEIRQSAE